MSYFLQQKFCLCIYVNSQELYVCEHLIAPNVELAIDDKYHLHPDLDFVFYESCEFHIRRKKNYCLARILQAKTLTRAVWNATGFKQCSYYLLKLLELKICILGICQASYRPVTFRRSVFM